MPLCLSHCFGEWELRVVYSESCEYSQKKGGGKVAMDVAFLLLQQPQTLMCCAIFVGRETEMEE